MFLFGILIHLSYLTILKPAHSGSRRKCKMFLGALENKGQSKKRYVKDFREHFR